MTIVAQKYTPLTNLQQKMSSAKPVISSSFIKFMTQKKCRISGALFTVDRWEKDFLTKISPNFNGKQYFIPEPTLCPKERMIRRLGFRNERSLFYRKCDLTGKQIVAQYPSNSEYKVYDKSVWYADDWNASEYGADFDFSRPFLSNFEHSCSECLVWLVCNKEIWRTANSVTVPLIARTAISSIPQIMMRIVITELL